MIRIGIVGAGAIARLHASQWHKLPVTIGAVYDIEPDRTETFCAHYGGRACASLDELLGLVDVVDVCTPTDNHIPIVLAAAAAGLPIVCEKPFGRHLHECERMIEACEATNTPLFVAHVVRFFPQYARAKEMVDSGAIGRTGMIRTTRAGSFPRPTATFGSPFYAEFARSGGVILDLGIHDIDYHRWVGGEIERVFARGLSYSGIPETDHAFLTLRFTSGAIGHIDCNWALPPGQFRTRLEITGDKGLIEWDTFEPPPLIWARTDPARPGQTEQGGGSPLASLDDPYCREFAHFLDCLQRGVPFLVSPYDALMAVKVALAATESVRTGLPVEIADFQEVAL